MFAEKAGIQLVQGRIVYNILSKGVLLRDAIKSAKMMND